MTRRRRTNLSRQSNVTRRRRTRLQQHLMQQSQEELQETQFNLRRENFMRANWKSMENASFSYDSRINYENHPMLQIGSMEKLCSFCGARKWPNERPGMCCTNGKISLPLIEEPPEPLKSLLSGETDDSKQFLQNIRKYNSCFQMTSFGADKEIHHGGFQPTFIVQGQIHHKIGSLLPVNGQEPAFLQIYFLGDGEQLNQRMQLYPVLKRETIQSLQALFHQHNGLIHEFKTALDNMPSDICRVVIYADRTPEGQHERRYNAPTANEVAVVITGNEYGNRDIVLKKHDGTLLRVADTHRYYDALQYPIMYWKGQQGYDFQIPQINPDTKLPTNKKVSSMDFYAYHIMVRNQGNIFLKCRQLFHQFIVDMYVKVESERLRYIKTHQTNLRAESYIHLCDAVAADANVDPNNLGQMVILPATFVNSPRYLAEYTQDAFAYVRKYGRPDLFITFTCNPSWPEIERELLPGQRHTDRHDLIARVFSQKLNKMVSSVTKGQIFGEAVAFMYSIEWQKRGLPHCHMLIWLLDKLQPNRIDDIICAELPNPDEDPLLSTIIVKNMVHGPCGSINPSSPCMKNGKCTKKFPRNFVSETQTHHDGYPLYRRRSPDEGGYSATINRRNAQITVDNSWIVPYSPLLSRMFSAHINVECCNSVKAIKYICKYINKGTDQAVFNIQNNQRRDEVDIYLQGRYVSSNEAVWRILALPLHERDPTVKHLAVHLENGERIYFNRHNLAQQLSNPPCTTLTAFFILCQEDNFAKTLLYNEVPAYYTWNIPTKRWKRRLQGVPVTGWPGVKRSNAIGRVYTVHVSNFDCFCLRLLLNKVRGPTSFNDLKTINGNLCNTYSEACELLGLLENDTHWDETMAEAVLTESPNKLRNLFALLVATCGLTNPEQTWDKYKDALSEDFMHQLQNSLAAFNEALIKIEQYVLHMTGKSLKDFGMQQPQQSIHNNIILAAEKNYDIHELNKYVTDNISLLTTEQKTIYDLVISKIANNEPSIIFIDAPGGTGKTFLLNLLLGYIRSKNEIAIALASSGIASTLLIGGKTAHSMLKLPLDLARNESPVCHLTKTSPQAEVLRLCKLMVWDEATMSHKRAIEALDRCLRDIRNAQQQLMGGLVVVLAGDFRQTLPVISRGTIADELQACLKESFLWPYIKTMRLTKNMRVYLHNDQEAEEFSKELMKIGNGELICDSQNKVLLTKCQFVSGMSQLIEHVFPNIRVNIHSDKWVSERAILAPKNEKVNHINESIISQIDGEEKTFLSIDTVVNPDESVNYPTEFLNSLELSGTPSHVLKLKVGVPVILLRNLDPPKLCNGTRLKVTKIGSHIISAKIIAGTFAGEEALLPRIPIIPTDLPFSFKRIQFPIKVAFAITINKAQGQTMKVAGVDLEEPCFSHGQLYVACSRVSAKENLHILAENGKTKNIVYKKALV